jgi:6-phosphogluconolactonase
MELYTFDDESAVARAAAGVIADAAREATSERGRLTLAFGGHTPWLMLLALADETIPWDRIHVVQVDERAAPVGRADRNLTHLRESLPGPAVRDRAGPRRAGGVNRFGGAARAYALTLAKLAGRGSNADTVGISDDSVREVGGLIKPETPVLFVLDEEGSMDAILRGIRGLGGTVLEDQRGLVEGKADPASGGRVCRYDSAGGR